MMALEMNNWGRGYVPTHPSERKIANPQAAEEFRVVLVSTLGAHARTMVSLYPNTMPP
jgi:hypothetical protein